jgi:hypothetical protein
MSRFWRIYIFFQRPWIRLTSGKGEIPTPIPRLDLRPSNSKPITIMTGLSQIQQLKEHHYITQGPNNLILRNRIFTYILCFSQHALLQVRKILLEAVNILRIVRICEIKLHHIWVWRSHCFMLLASRKYSIPLHNSLLSSISSSYLATVSLHSHEARTGHVTRSRIQLPPPQSDTQPSRGEANAFERQWVSKPASYKARQSINHTKQDRLIIRTSTRRLIIFTKDFRYLNLHKILHGLFHSHPLQFKFRSPLISTKCMPSHVFGKAPLNSSRINHQSVVETEN